eukprot:2210036-Pleurochrysis_carterae.AAC.5
MDASAVPRASSTFAGSFRRNLWAQLHLDEPEGEDRSMLACMREHKLNSVSAAPQTASLFKPSVLPCS